MARTKKHEYLHTSFYLKPIDQEQLRYVAKCYGENPSAVMRRLIAEAYALQKHKAESHCNERLGLTFDE